MSDDDKFEPKEEMNDKSEIITEKEGSNRTIIYSFLMLITGIGFMIGAILAGGLVSGVLCLFETMTVFTNELGALDGDQDIFDMASDQYMMCMTNSITSPITILSGLVGGFFTGYPSYNLAKRVSNGDYLKTII